TPAPPAKASPVVPAGASTSTRLATSASAGPQAAAANRSRRTSSDASRAHAGSGGSSPTYRPCASNQPSGSTASPNQGSGPPAYQASLPGPSPPPAVSLSALPGILCSAPLGVSNGSYRPCRGTSLTHRPLSSGHAAPSDMTVIAAPPIR